MNCNTARLSKMISCNFQSWFMESVSLSEIVILRQSYVNNLYRSRNLAKYDSTSCEQWRKWQRNFCVKLSNQNCKKNAINLNNFNQLFIYFWFFLSIQCIKNNQLNLIKLPKEINEWYFQQYNFAMSLVNSVNCNKK